MNKSKSTRLTRRRRDWSDPACADRAIRWTPTIACDIARAPRIADEEGEPAFDYWAMMREIDAEDARWEADEAFAAYERENIIASYPAHGYGLSDCDECAFCGETIMEWEHYDGYRVWTHGATDGPDFTRRACADTLG